MGVPKRKPSKSRKRMRIRSHRRPLAATMPCPKCGAPRLPHRACPNCGTYGGRQVLIIKPAEKK